jgi:hypothetical protein
MSLQVELREDKEKVAKPGSYLEWMLLRREHNSTLKEIKLTCRAERRWGGRSRVLGCWRARVGAKPVEPPPGSAFLGNLKLFAGHTEYCKWVATESWRSL